MQHWVVEKEALTARGRFPRSTVRPPFQPLPVEHIEGIRKAVAAPASRRWRSGRMRALKRIVLASSASQ
jgi:hypothetical protein